MGSILGSKCLSQKVHSEDCTHSSEWASIRINRYNFWDIFLVETIWQHIYSGVAYNLTIASSSKPGTLNTVHSISYILDIIKTCDNIRLVCHSTSPINVGKIYYWLIFFEDLSFASKVITNLVQCWVCRQNTIVHSPTD